MDKIPNYASVHSTVEASKKSSKIFSKTVNAILIKFIKNNGKINFKNLEHNYHCNILSEWKGQYSKEELKSLYAWNNTIPTIWFYIKKEFDRKDKRMSEFNFKAHPDIENYISSSRPREVIEEFVKKAVKKKLGK